MLEEARLRLDAAATNLAHAAVGNAEPQDVLVGSLRLIDHANRSVEQAREP
jgi:hypothetical protein